MAGRSLRLERGDGAGGRVQMLREKLGHEHRHLIAEQRLDAAFGAQPHGHGQHVARTDAAEPLMHPVQFDHRRGRVELGTAQRAAKPRAVGPDAGGFLGGKLFHANTSGGPAPWGGARRRSGAQPCRTRRAG